MIFCPPLFRKRPILASFLLQLGKELRPLDEHGEAQYLSDYNIQDEGNLFLVLRLLGGSEQPDQEPDVPKAYGPDVQLTDLPDMFTLDDEEGGQRALMPCKHAIGNLDIFSSLDPRALWELIG